MNNSQLPIAVRTTAAALAVFMATATLNTMVSIAEPQQSRLMARTAPRQVAEVASTLRGASDRTHRTTSYGQKAYGGGPAANSERT